MYMRSGRLPRGKEKRIKKGILMKEGQWKLWIDNLLLVCVQGLFVCSPDWLQLVWRCIRESSTMKSVFEFNSLLSFITVLQTRAHYHFYWLWLFWKKPQIQNRPALVFLLIFHRSELSGLVFAKNLNWFTLATVFCKDSTSKSKYTPKFDSQSLCYVWSDPPVWSGH